jgi:hypothetical protein
MVLVGVNGVIEFEKQKFEKQKGRIRTVMEPTNH